MFGVVLGASFVAAGVVAAGVVAAGVVAAGVPPVFPPLVPKAFAPFPPVLVVSYYFYSSYCYCYYYYSYSFASYLSCFSFSSRAIASFDKGLVL